jgi:hypothetical protein
MKREDVEALYARVLRDADSAAGRGVKLADMTFSVEGDILEALCRRWLAVEEAAVGRRYSHAEDDWIVTPDEDGGVTIPYQRVRIVPEDGQEVGNG